jgi:hypothetical protein
MKRVTSKVYGTTRNTAALQVVRECSEFAMGTIEEGVEFAVWEKIHDSVFSPLDFELHDRGLESA